MTPDERYLSIAQELYLHLVKENSSALLDYQNTILEQHRLAEIALLADYAAAAFAEQFDTTDA